MPSSAETYLQRLAEQGVELDTTGLTLPVSEAAGAQVDGHSATLGATTDAPADVVEATTARTGISLWKGIKNYLKTLAGAVSAGKVQTTGIVPTFSASASLTRPANTTAYAANKSINCSLTVTAGSYTGLVVTLTSNGHGLVAGDRITVAGINTGFTWTNVDGNWVVTSSDTNTFTFTVLVQPTGTSPASATVNNAIAKMLSIVVADAVGQGIILSRLSLSCQGVQMTGAIRCYVYTAQTTVLVDQSTFTLLNANDANRRDYYDLSPVTEGSGSDVTFASQRLWEVFQCAAADTRLYFRLVAEGASTPVSGGVITLRATGIKLLG